MPAIPGRAAHAPAHTAGPHRRPAMPPCGRLFELPGEPQQDRVNRQFEAG
ncbi:pyridine nucleotide-disulphide oxidoreductase, class II [Burkholderia pseudomallei Pakistan 9]|nr:pyridine nucleotide-disulphide oxidoreductase, class II [Burkholderia pseudomallei Pakistan 9]